MLSYLVQFQAPDPKNKKTTLKKNFSKKNPAQVQNTQKTQHEEHVIYFSSAKTKNQKEKTT